MFPSLVVYGSEKMAILPNGYYQPLYLEPIKSKKKSVPKLKRGKKIPVRSFKLDRYPVTREEFQKFVEQKPEWRASRVKRIFADTTYLHDWPSDLEIGIVQNPNSPVRFVSWFAARAYCESLHKRLPTIAEWEYAASSYKNIKDLQKTILNWYSRSTPETFGKVGSTFSNDFGVFDLHGLVWEWVEDFNSSLVTGESRADASLDQASFCGSGGLNALNFKDYAAFMRFAFRNSLGGSFAIANLGFRCAKDLNGRDTK